MTIAMGEVDLVALNNGRSEKVSGISGQRLHALREERAKTQDKLKERKMEWRDGRQSATTARSETTPGIGNT